jgi:hypothetical protein
MAGGYTPQRVKEAKKNRNVLKHIVSCQNNQKCDKQHGQPNNEPIFSLISAVMEII